MKQGEIREWGFRLPPRILLRCIRAAILPSKRWFSLRAVSGYVKHHGASFSFISGWAAKVTSYYQ